MATLSDWARPLLFRLVGRAGRASAQRLRRLPVLGPALHRVSHRLSPPGVRAWMEIRAGAGRGLWLRLDPRYDAKYWRGDVEPLVQKRLTELLQPGAVFWDVGASLGFFTLIASRIVGPSGRVVAFEPDAAMAALLREHVVRNDVRNAAIHEVAAWSSAGQLSFGRAGIPGHIHGRVGGVDATTSVDAVTLDAFEDERPPDVIKIDVEGAEEEVLRGAHGILGRARPDVVCEIHLERHHETSSLGRAERVKALLEELGYELEELHGGGGVFHVVAVAA